MRRWIPRALWLVAWGVWAWLGVGLFHQLPRDLGPVVRRLPVEKGGAVLGFVGESNSVAIKTPQVPPEPYPSVLVLDAESGVKVGVWQYPQIRRGVSTPIEVIARSLRFGVLFGAREQQRSDNGRRISALFGGFYALDCLSGKWRRLSSDREVRWALHPHKPWVAIVTGWGYGDLPRAAVVDYVTGREVFQPTLGKSHEVVSAPFFIPERNELAMAIREPRAMDAIGSPFFYQVWRIPDPAPRRSISRLPIAALPDQYPTSMSDGGRVISGVRLARPDKLGNTRWFDVIDFGSGAFLSSVPGDRHTGVLDYTEGGARVMIAPSGRVVLRGKPAALYEVGTGRTTWKAGPAETVVSSDDRGGFVVAEPWDQLWGRWLPGLRYETRARRNLETGELIVRTPGTAAVEPRNLNATGTLLVLGDGAVHRWPLPRNWTMFVICQAVLGMPMILIWAALRVRRKRRLRAAGASL